MCERVKIRFTKTWGSALFYRYPVFFPNHVYQVSDACNVATVDENFIQNFRPEM